MIESEQFQPHVHIYTTPNVFYTVIKVRLVSYVMISLC